MAENTWVCLGQKNFDTATFSWFFGGPTLHLFNWFVHHVEIPYCHRKNAGALGMEGPYLFNLPVGAL